MNNALAVGIGLVALAASCDYPTDGLGWEEFVAQAERSIGGRTVYVVEGDLGVQTLGDLREYYDARYGGPDSPFRSVVNVFDGERDVWPGQEALNLTYCVSTDFGPDYARAKSELAAAAAAWEAVANVDFEHVGEDDACDNQKFSGVFSFRPDPGVFGACAFFPGETDPDYFCTERTLIIDYGDYDDPPPGGTVRTLTHELGHILGLRHEMEHPDGCGAWADGEHVEALTEYDLDSIMHYFVCGKPENATTLTSLDGEGVRELYGMPAAWYVASGAI